jgi:predicted ATPase
MIKEVRLENWKSFPKATLYLDPITILIGTNASGKSNVLDALDLLSQIAQGKEISSILQSDPKVPTFRGGAEWAALKPERSFRVEALIEGGEPNIDYLYSLTVQTLPKPKLLAESLLRLKYRPRSKSAPYTLKLFWTKGCEEDDPAIVAILYNTTRGAARNVQRSSSVLSQLKLSTASLRKEIAEGVNAVVRGLNSIFILNPIPSHMRYFSPLAEKLANDASNIAGVLAALPDERRTSVETTLQQYVKDLPEKDIQRVWTEKVGSFATDAALLCEEGWKSAAEPTKVDARAMSDGTLRFLAILTALLTLPERSQLIIEEVDNGLHPSRSDMLINMLRTVGASRHIDVLATTHNPALLNRLGPEMVPFVVVAHRNRQSGASELTLLEDLANLPKLIAMGPLGEVAASGELESSLQSSGGNHAQ